jgi:hypothetical protein
LDHPSHAQSSNHAFQRYPQQFHGQCTLEFSVQGESQSPTDSNRWPLLTSSSVFWLCRMIYSEERCFSVPVAALEYAKRWSRQSCDVGGFLDRNPDFLHPLYQELKRFLTQQMVHRRSFLVAEKTCYMRLPQTFRDIPSRDVHTPRVTCGRSNLSREPSPNASVNTEGSILLSLVQPVTSYVLSINSVPMPSNRWSR